MNNTFKGKKLQVVGGTSGMGLETARMVLEQGGSAVIVGHREDKAEEARVGTPQEVAQVMAFLPSDQASWVTGEVIDFSLPAERVVRALGEVIEWRGKPKAIHRDNGPEYVSSKLMLWAEKHGIRPSTHTDKYRASIVGEQMGEQIHQTQKSPD